MNIQKMLVVADLVESEGIEGLGLDMATFYSPREKLPYVSPNPCGTVACLAGHTVAAYDGLSAIFAMPNEANNEVVPYPERDEIFKRAQEILELTDEQARRLFMGCTDSGLMPRDGALAMRNMARTGDPDWRSILDRYATEREREDD